MAERSTKLNAFTTPSTATFMYRSVPLVAEPRLDGYNKLGLMLLYSDHEGLCMLKEHAAEFNSGSDPSMIVRNEATPFGFPSIPVENAAARDTIKEDEFVLNDKKFPGLFETMLAAGLVQKTGNYVDQGFYGQIPVVRFTPPTANTSRADNDLDDRGSFGPRYEPSIVVVILELPPNDPELTAAVILMFGGSNRKPHSKNQLFGSYADSAKDTYVEACGSEVKLVCRRNPGIP